VSAQPGEAGASQQTLPRIRVVAAALYDGAGRVLIAQRPPGKHLAGRWEFPGGKVQSGAPLLTLTHRYSDRTVELSLWVVERYSGEPRSLEGQPLRWVSVAGLGAEDILEADRPFVEALQRRAMSQVGR